MHRLIAFTIPGSEEAGQELPVPGGIPNALRGNLSTSGVAIVQLILNGLSLLIVISAVIFILYAGIRYITSEGDPETLAEARKQLTYAIIGLVVASLAFFLIRVVIVVIGGSPEFFFKF